ncbi:branched-chain amino acid aminotransferase [Phycicoccus endophyticus]|uniref:Branched-chain-amino-acid aminotransferase n=1 Tax=Phycicoccus endophyticus TaxID=1690220 RepID=A0A7G9QYE1_9MICO|nr:branched-chain amino acid aminotransferase [Phycicoccus endophyticus]NHI19261.1 branched-chain amino acid aminotransferase [Phycicoccus endophyticus]QNN48366.1 branched-chain amino acid aminotransferase [Phycicoccus endophyticus]GGL41365.1 branched-chain-amino-acid aminotransferase [Phycicoccus endophyticus]
MSLTFDLQRRPDPTSDERRTEILADPGFGVHFTDHMATATWTRDAGWHDARVHAYGPVSLMPSAAVLHYAQEVFEGLKAYRHEDGSVWSFRPEANAERMQRSARRLALPELATEDFLASLEALVQVDQAWVPAAGTGETSLYLRPFMYASEAFLGVRPAAEVTYSVIASPAGAYFAGGLQPVTLWVSEHYARAGAGGTGAAKTGGNYASSLAGQLEGIEHGCDQAVFLDSATHTYIEELGGMNLFFVTDDGRLVTPELTGTILEGVTRGSILELAKDLGLTPQERRIEIAEWKDGVRDGSIREVFACGTAAVVTPVGALRWEGGEAPSTAGEQGGEVTRSLRAALLDLQYGRAEDTHGWLTRLA